MGRFRIAEEDQHIGTGHDDEGHGNTRQDKPVRAHRVRKTRHAEHNGGGPKCPNKGQQRNSEKADEQAGVQQCQDRAERPARGNTQQMWVRERVARDRLQACAYHRQTRPDHHREDRPWKADFPDDSLAPLAPGLLDQSGADLVQQDAPDRAEGNGDRPHRDGKRQRDQ